MHQQSHTVTLPSGVSFVLILVEGGSFLMGSEVYSEEKPVHEVKLSSFYLGKFLVTQALWKAVMGAENTPFDFPGDERPAERISWYDAAVFCNQLSVRQGLTPFYYADESFGQAYGRADAGWKLPIEGEVFLIPTANGFRLPTEAEWEFAARGGTKSEGYEYAGSNRLKEVGWHDANSYGETKPVGMKAPNELGLYDMSGNVWEWVEDQWYNNYNGAPTDGSARVSRDGERTRVLRGGAWNYDQRGCRCTYRSRIVPRGLNEPRSRLNYIGFRLALPYQPGNNHPVRLG